MAQLARTIAEHLNDTASKKRLLATFGGIDPDAAEAAALAHDIGHPPFGHIGEEVLDRIAKDWGLVGYEGNAQSFRIVTRLEQHALDDTRGLDLTTRTLAGIVKYPWARYETDDGYPLAQDASDLPRRELRQAKFCSYESAEERSEQRDTDFSRVLDFLPVDPSGRPMQSVEASVMDIADDITYAMHDLEDFYRSRIISGGLVLQSVDDWTKRADTETRSTRIDNSGDIIAKVQSKLQRDYPDRFRPDHLELAVQRVGNSVATALTDPFDGRPSRVSTVRAMVSSAITEAIASIEVGSSQQSSLAVVRLGSEDWHFIEVLKGLTRHFVIARPNVASVQRGQRRLLRNLVKLVDEWQAEEPARLPRMLIEYIDSAYAETDSALAPRRAVLDYVSSLSDHQAIELHRVLHGGLVELAGGFV